MLYTWIIAICITAHRCFFLLQSYELFFCSHMSLCLIKKKLIFDNFYLFTSIFPTFILLSNFLLKHSRPGFSSFYFKDFSIVSLSIFNFFPFFLKTPYFPFFKISAPFYIWLNAKSYSINLLCVFLSFNCKFV